MARSTDKTCAVWSWHAPDYGLGLMIRAGLLALALGATYAAWRLHRAWTTAWDADKTAYDAMSAREYASEE